MTKKEIEKETAMVVKACLLVTTTEEKVIADEGLTKDAVRKSASLLCDAIEKYNEYINNDEPWVKLFMVIDEIAGAKEKGDGLKVGF